ncbi:hypothetical protein DEO72_LG3g1543 [Vigna unguiculata]|uniref:Uncharacterized protein n=1 Tax=Vigna unguiculata TaxID=3917 RepID=A0A4D6LEI8_VIGUN|nr:hypothetical protein DEO72_LG3g1543 [Vigna unguiculata]
MVVVSMVRDGGAVAGEIGGGGCVEASPGDSPFQEGRVGGATQGAPSSTTKTQGAEVETTTTEIEQHFVPKPQPKFEPEQNKSTTNTSTDDGSSGNVEGTNEAAGTEIEKDINTEIG